MQAPYGTLLWQIYSRPCVPNFIRIGLVQIIWHDKTFWLNFSDSTLYLDFYKTRRLSKAAQFKRYCLCEVVNVYNSRVQCSVANLFRILSSIFSESVRFLQKIRQKSFGLLFSGRQCMYSSVEVEHRYVQIQIQIRIYILLMTTFTMMMIVIVMSLS